MNEHGPREAARLSHPLRVAGIGGMGEEDRQEGCPGLVSKAQCQAIPVPPGLTKRGRGKGWEFGGKYLKILLGEG